MGTVSGTYDDQDRMTAYGTASYTCGAAGDLRTRTVGSQTTTYSYDALGNLMGAWLPDGRVIEYIADGLNRRVGKKVNGALTEGFLYDGQLRPVAWLNGAGQVYATFVYGLKVNVPEYMTTSAGTFRILTDHLGSPRIVVNTATGAVAQRMDYDAFGQVLADTSPGFQPFGFAGGLYDRDTGLVRFGARDYDPGVGRWTNKDPLRFDGGDGNLYAYSANDPVNFTDPTGEFLWVAAGAAIGAGVNVAMTVWAAGGWDNVSGQQLLAAAASGAISGGLGALAGPLGGSVAGALGYASNGVAASVAAMWLSAGAGAGAAGQAAANAINPCGASSVAAAGFFGGIGGGLTKYLFPTKNLNTLLQSGYFGPSTLAGLFGSGNAFMNLGSFGTAAGVGGAANFPQVVGYWQ